MKPLFSILLLPLIVMSCKTDKDFTPKNISKVEIETLKQDSLLNVRALEVYQNEGVFATAAGSFGGILQEHVSRNGKSVNQVLVIDTIQAEGGNPNFRSMSMANCTFFLLSITSPSYLYKIDKDTLELVYQEHHPKAFYDSMAFWNDQEGIAIGDPTDDCMSIIITRDGGNTWHKMPCDSLPKAKKGEAAFAASDTNIAIVGDKTWVATGGISSRVLYSPDKGKSWQVFNTPIIQGKETTGMYSIDFYDDKNGFAIGGDYTNPEANVANKIRTTDGGKTWQLVADGSGPGYRSCVQYVPNAQAKALVAVGFKGIDYSSDAGHTWSHLSDESFYTIRFLNDSTAYAAGQGRISKLMFR